MAKPGDELQLVLLAQCDDPEAVEALLVSIQSRLLRFVSGLVGDRAAEDVLQDVFVKIWRNLKWLNRPELFRPWAFRIASRTCFEYLKRERRDNAVLAESVPDSVASIDTALPAGLEHLLDRVSPASRAVLLLHYGQDLSIEEAAAILGISIGTAKSRLSYGLSCLRRATGKKE